MAQETLAPVQATLDHNGQVPITLKVRRNSGDHDNHLTLSLDLSSFSQPEVLAGDKGHFPLSLRLKAHGKIISTTPIYSHQSQRLEFNSSEIPKDCESLELMLNERAVVTWNRVANSAGPEFALDESQLHHRLTVDDLRLLAISKVRRDNVPASRTALKGFDPKKHAPITDLHTHSSAQLSAKDLMDMALTHNLNYPIELLAKLGITEFTAEERQGIKLGKGRGLRFSPCEADDLDCEKQNKPCDVISLQALNEKHRLQLQEQLKIPQDATICFSDFDRQYYRFVNPLVKNPLITHDMILKIAEDYKKNGVQYAELSTAAMLNLDEEGKASWFEHMIDAVNDAEKETGVKLRFLIGIPRNYSPAKVMVEIEKCKYALRHPLVAGIDLLGYEYNRTSDFSAMLSHVAGWAQASEETDLRPQDGWDFKRDMTIRIHAGETGKNHSNVSEAVKIAERYGVHMRVAHVLNAAKNPELDAHIRKLSASEPPLISFEFCPSSNIAYNNAHGYNDIPYARWLKVAKSWFLGSDGAGAIQTTPTQLALSAIAGGVSLDQLEKMQTNERVFIDDQLKRFEAKTKAYHAHYAGNADQEFLKGFAEHVKGINKLDTASPTPGEINKTALDALLGKLAAAGGSAADSADLDEIRKLATKVKKPVSDTPYYGPELPKQFNDKMPILVGGSAVLDDKQRREIRETARMLVAAVDPKKAYFVFGRSKDENVIAAFDDAILDHNAKYPANKFSVLSLTTQNTTEIAHSTSWIVSQSGGLDQVPDNLFGFMKGRLNMGTKTGLNLFMGGTSFTNDMIKKTIDSNKMKFLLCEDVQGASKQFAALSLPENRFNNGKSLLTRISNMFTDKDHPECTLFRKGINIENEDTLRTLEKEAGKGGFSLGVSSPWKLDPNAPTGMSRYR